MSWKYERERAQRICKSGEGAAKAKLVYGPYEILQEVSWRQKPCKNKAASDNVKCVKKCYIYF
jgi:hypothetical protein